MPRSCDSICVFEWEWDEDNVEHLDRHGVSPEEAEEALRDPRAFSVPAHPSRREPRYALVGATEARRVLFVVYTRRAGAVRVVTARDADPPHRRRYRRK